MKGNTPLLSDLNCAAWIACAALGLVLVASCLWLKLQQPKGVAQAVGSHMALGLPVERSLENLARSNVLRTSRPS